MTILIQRRWRFVQFAIYVKKVIRCFNSLKFALKYLHRSRKKTFIKNFTAVFEFEVILHLLHIPYLNQESIKVSKVMT